MYSPKYMSFILRVHVVGNIFFPFPASPPCQRLARIVYQFHGFSLANFCLILRSKLGGFVVLFWPEQPQRWGRRAGRGLRVGQWTQWGRWRTQRSGGRVAAATAARAPFWHAGRSCAAAWRRRVARSHRRALYTGDVNLDADRFQIYSLQLFKNVSNCDLQNFVSLYVHIPWFRRYNCRSKI